MDMEWNGIGRTQQRAGKIHGLEWNGKKQIQTESNANKHQFLGPKVTGSDCVL